MSNQWTKFYNKAMDFYNKGQINKALEICEKILGDDLSSSEILNLKGLMLYQKGQLNEAKTIWKLNQDLNHDKMAEKYVDDSESDGERLKLYKEAEQKLKNMNIDQALILFRQCAKSDFNSIKVNTGLAMCYQRKGDNFRAKEYVDKALSVDVDAVTANSIKKELIKTGVYSNENNISKNILVIATIIFIIGAVSSAGYSIYRKVKLNNVDDQYISNIQEDNNNDEKLNTEDISNNIKNETIIEELTEQEKDKDTVLNEDLNNTDKKVFNNENLIQLIKSKDVDNIYDELDGIDKDNIGTENLQLYNNAVSILKNEGVSKFYEYGVWNFNNGSYDLAKKELDKAYKYCDGNNLKEHIIFYRGSTASQQSDNSTALKLYKEYYSLYPKGAYIEGVLYELALLTNTTNKDMGKEYAKQLVDNYPNSLYINDYIKEIIK